MKIAFIGLGIMGSRMACNLLSNNFNVTVYNRSIQKVDELEIDGAKIAKTPSEAVKEVKVVITMLSTPDAVREVAMSNDGFLQALAENSIWIDCSTVSPTFSKEMAEECTKRKIRFIDAPVAGSKIPAAKGQLVFLAGGNIIDIEECMPLFNSMGKKVIIAGENGYGSALKLTVNSLMGVALNGYVESLWLGESLGIDKKTLIETFNQLPVTSPALIMKQDKFINDDYEPEFPLQWMHKDLYLAAEEGYKNNQALPVINAVKEQFAKAKQAGFAENDFSALYKIK